MDALDDASRVDRLRDFCEQRDLEMFEVSAVTGYGIDKFIHAVGARVEQIRKPGEMAVSGF